jgi:hypothetical protein
MMKTIGAFSRGAAPLVLAGALLALAGPALAHCDGLDGPVVKAARQALETGDVNRVLIWVKPEAEAEARAAFGQAVAVRKLGAVAKALADTYLFETVVRLHRAGEGAPYTGLKPAGRDLGPAIPAADQAIETGSVESLLKLLGERMQAGVREHFEHVQATRGFKSDDVEAGRGHVATYVEFIHYVERLYDASVTPAHGHVTESEAARHEH